MQKYSYIVPFMKGARKPFEVHDEQGIVRAKVQRYFPNLLHTLTEMFITGWEVHVKALQDGQEYLIKEHFHWTKNKWSIFEDGLIIGTLMNIKKIEMGDSKEITIKGKKFYYLDKALQTQTLIQDEEKNVIAVIDHKLMDLSRKKEITIYSSELPVSLLVGIDYVSSLKKK